MEVPRWEYCTRFDIRLLGVTSAPCCRCVLSHEGVCLSSQPPIALSNYVHVMLRAPSSLFSSYYYLLSSEGWVACRGRWLCCRTSLQQSTAMVFFPFASSESPPTTRIQCCADSSFFFEHEQSNQQIKKEDKGESASLSAPRYTRYLGAWLTERVDDREQTKDLIR